MPKEFSRRLRIEEMIQRELATLISQEIKDPRLGMVTVSAVTMSPDLKHAKIFVTILTPGHDEKDQDNSVKILNHAAGFLRHALATRLYLKSIPALRFVNDVTALEAARLSGLIDKAIASENQERGRQT